MIEPNLSGDDGTVTVRIPMSIRRRGGVPSQSKPCSNRFVNGRLHCREVGPQVETLDRESDGSAWPRALRVNMMRTSRRRHANAVDEISVDREDR